MILFYHPDHTDTKTTFRLKVTEELAHEKGDLKFATKVNGLLYFFFNFS